MNPRKILTVSRRDFKSIFINPVAIIISLGISVLPALYAWINIKACWNPYTHTSSIPVAVVNLDEGTSYLGKSINVGDETVENLKKNHDIKWSFVSAKDADLGIVDGTYYAEIRITSDFSKDFVSFLGSSPTRPQIVYKLNTKVNPVANKITDTAKNTLVDQISTSFVATVNKTVYSYLNGVGKSAEQSRDDILTFKKDIVAVHNNMDLILSALQTVDERSANLSEFLMQLQAAMPDADTSLQQLLSANRQNEKTVQSAKTALNQSLDDMAVSLANTTAQSQRIHDTATALNRSSATMTQNQINSSIAEMELDITTLDNGIDSLVSYLTSVNESSPNASVSKLISELQTLRTSLDAEKTSLDTLSQQMQKANTLNSQTLQQLIEQSAQAVSGMTAAAGQYDTQVRPALNTIADNLSAALSDADTLITGAQGLSTQIDNLMQGASNGSTLAAKVSGDLHTRLVQYRDMIATLSDKLSQISDSDIDKIIAVLQNDPTLIGSYLSSPFDLKEEAIYAIPNYGSAMSPIYTVLALWVGTLILTAILRTEPPDFPGSESIGLREKFYGKMLTFLCFSVLQALIITLGNKLILGVYTVSFPLMMAVAVVSAVTFTMITFTLVALFGNVGKAVSIIYLILQIAGSGGSYPIQVDPLFFQILQPLFPFTYSLEGLRESIGGPEIQRVLVDFIALLLMQAMSFAFGYFLRAPLYDRMQRFHRKFREAGIGE